MHETPLPSRSVTVAARADAERHWRAGVEHARAGRWKEAEKAHARAAKAAPDDPLFLVNLGQARSKLGDLDGAVAAAEQALRLDPDCGIAVQLRLAATLARHRYVDALEDAARLVARPEATHAHWFEYGVALDRSGRHHEAAAALLRALGRKPDFFEAHVELCNAFDRMKLHAEAVECLRTALALRPTWAAALCGVIYHSLYACDWRRLDEDLAALRERLASDEPPELGPFMLLASGIDAATQRRVAEDHARRFWGQVVPLPRVEPPRASSDGRIRIGYLSNDFHLHATSVLIVRTLELHDRDRFDVRLYSYGRDDGSELRRRVAAACDAFVDVEGRSDAEIARRIRDDGVEILVDLKGYTLHARTGVMALRPAPVQVAWLGYPGTLGAPFLDYAVVDPVVVPPGSEDEFTERLAWLPDCYQPNDRLRIVGDPPGRAACGLPEDGVVFCCFNHTYKIRPEVFDVWCRLLREVPGSVLWLLESNPQVRANLEREALARGVDPARLVMAPLTGSTANLGRLTHADLFLDTLPVNAHTTASDALWAGVPVLTCAGDSFVGRVAASLLHAVGLPELVADDLAGYESLARALAGDRPRLKALRERLRVARTESPLFDSERTARELEGLYRRMSERWRAGLAPDHLPPRRVVVARGAPGPAARPAHPVHPVHPAAGPVETTAASVPLAERGACEA